MFANFLSLNIVLTPCDEKISAQPPEYAEIMLFLRRHILDYNPHIAETFKYMTLYYEYKGKGICFMHLKDDYVYLGFYSRGKLKHPKLHAEGRKVIKLFKCFINKNVDVRSLNSILKEACKIAEQKVKS